MNPEKSLSAMAFFLLLVWQWLPENHDSTA